MHGFQNTYTIWCFKGGGGGEVGSGVALGYPMFIGHPSPHPPPPIQKKLYNICMYVYICMCMYVCIYVFEHNAELSAIVVDISKDAFLNNHKEVKLQLFFPCGC